MLNLSMRYCYRTQHVYILFIFLRVTCIRLLSLSSRPSAKSTDDSSLKDEPIKFSTSKASHKTWKVDSSLGSRYERPWWKVLPVSLFCISIILWCALREETDVDRNLHENMFQPSDKEKEEWMGLMDFTVCIAVRLCNFTLLPVVGNCSFPLMLGDNVQLMLTTVNLVSHFFFLKKNVKCIPHLKENSIISIRTQSEVADSFIYSMNKVMTCRLNSEQKKRPNWKPEWWNIVLLHLQIWSFNLQWIK